MSREIYTKAAITRVIKALRMTVSETSLSTWDRLDQVKDPYKVKRWSLIQLHEKGRLKRDKNKFIRVVEWHRLHYGLSRFYWAMDKHQISAGEFDNQTKQRTFTPRGSSRKYNFNEWLRENKFIYEGESDHMFVSPIRKSKNDVWYVEGEFAMLMLITQEESQYQTDFRKQKQHLKSIVKEGKA